MAEGQGIRASARFVQMSPQKVRLVVDMVRGRDVVEALELLRYTPKAAAKPVAKVVRSAVANAEENLAFSRDELYISEIYADQGPTRRWRRFGGRGRFKPIKKRSSHITVILREREPAGG
jgi:large subunit ribosomal protein L22